MDVASTKRDPVLYYIGQAKWTSTISSKLLFETGYSVDILHYANYYQAAFARSAARRRGTRRRRI